MENRVMGLSRRTFTAERQEGFQISLRRFGKVARRLIQQTRMVKIFMRRGYSTGVSRQGVLDSGCHIADRAQAEQGRGRAARCSCLGGCALRDNALGTG